MPLQVVLPDSRVRAPLPRAAVLHLPHALALRRGAVLLVPLGLGQQVPLEALLLGGGVVTVRGGAPEGLCVLVGVDL